MVAPFIPIYLLYLSALYPVPGLVLPPKLKWYPLGTLGSTPKVGCRAPILRGSVVRGDCSALGVGDSDATSWKTSSWFWKLL